MDKRWSCEISIHFSPQVANLACSMSSNEEGVKMVRMAATEIDSLCVQVNVYFLH